MLFVIEIDRLHVHLLGATANPSGPWVKQVARNFASELEDAGHHFPFLIRNRDNPGRFTSGERFRRAVRADRPPGVPRSGNAAWRSPARAVACDPREALQRGAPAPWPRTETAGRFTALDSPHLRAKRSRCRQTTISTSRTRLIIQNVDDENGPHFSRASHVPRKLGVTKSARFVDDTLQGFLCDPADLRAFFGPFFEDPMGVPTVCPQAIAQDG